MHIQKKECPEFQGIPAQKVQFWCLLALGLIDFIWVTLRHQFPLGSEFFMEHYLMPPALVFVGAALTTKLTRSGVKDLALGGFFLIWMALIQVIQCENWESMENLTLFWPVYLLAFPFASVVQDGEKQKGLRLMGAIAVIIAMIMVLCSAMLSVWILPEWLMEAVKWDNEVRLAALTHPNASGWLFMVGIGFTLGFFFEAKNKWLKWILLGAAGSQLLMQALTNSRTTNLLTCGMIGMIFFFAAPKTNRKRILAAALACLVLAGGLFVASGKIFDWNFSRMTRGKLVWDVQAEEIKVGGEESNPSGLPEADTEEYGDPEESGGEPEILFTRNGFLTDLLTLTGRTSIWKGALNTLGNHPEYLLRGTAQVGVTAIEGGNPFGVMHLHNSWLQMLVGFGIPGLLVALYLTVLALRGIWTMLFTRRSSMWRKCIAMLAACMLVAGILEPFLFTGYTYCHFISVIFMLCTGYLNQWYLVRE